MNKHKKYRILVNDYAGHPFQVQLSRWLAKQGHEVLHTYCSSIETPRGTLQKASSDPTEFRIEGISLDREFNKYALISRWRQEKEFGEKIVRRAEAFQPDVVISANTPLGSQRKLTTYANKSNIPFIFWLQDVYGYGIRCALRRRLPLLGDFIGRYFESLERRIWRHSNHVIVITEDFMPKVEQAGVAKSRITTIRNWAPLEELPVRVRRNTWSERHGLSDKHCFLYSGTLGFKHNPDLLIALAEEFRDRDDVRIVINSEGQGADYIQREKARRNLRNLVLFDFQPFEQMPDVLATGDVLVTLLEQDAGEFAVPSKVLTYLCAGRPLLLAVPAGNLAARIVLEANAGRVAPPGDTRGFVTAARELMENDKMRQAMALNSRAYAEAKFNIDGIGRKFEEIIETTTFQLPEEKR